MINPAVKYGVFLSFLLLMGCSDDGNPSPTPGQGTPSQSPSAMIPTETPAPTPSPSPSPTGVEVVVEVVDEWGEPWEGAIVFAGVDGQGPVVTTGEDGLARLLGVAPTTTLSVFHRFTARYSEFDAYTVNRINSYVDVDHGGTHRITLERTQDWQEPGPALGQASGAVLGVDERVEASRIYVSGPDAGVYGPPASDFTFDFDYHQPLNYLYAAQVPAVGNGDYALETMPLAYALVLDPASGGQDLTLDRHFSSQFTLSPTGLDGRIHGIYGQVDWILPGNRGRLPFESPSLSPVAYPDAPIPLPEAAEAYAGDGFEVEAIALGDQMSQRRQMGSVERGGHYEAAFYPVPDVSIYLPVRSDNFPGSEIEVTAHSGAENTVFHFAERWYRINGPYGGYLLWYDLWTVIGDGATEAITLPQKPTSVDWPTDLGAIWSLLDRFSYIRADYPEGDSIRELETMPVSQ